MVVFKEHFIKNMPIVSIFDSLMIIIWACFPAYNTFKIFKFKFKLKWWHPFAFILTVIILFFIALVFVKFLQWFLEMPSQSLVKKLTEANYSFTSIILLICVQPAIIEELAFRGIVFKVLEKALKPVETVLISGFLFAMLHLSLISLPILFLLGIFFGYIRYKTGSIYPSMIAHFLHNFAVIIFDKMGWA